MMITKKDMIGKGEEKMAGENKNQWFRYVAESAISYLIDNDLFEDFVEDRDMDFTEKDLEYFGIEA